MNSVTNDKKVIPVSFPCLMISITHETIILVTSKSTINTFIGTCVNTGTSTNTIGKYSKDWSMSCFILYEGDVTLSN